MSTALHGPLTSDAHLVTLAPEVAVDQARLTEIAVERTRMPMCVTDPQLPDNPIVFVNQAFLDTTGYPADEVIGRNCRFLQGPKTDAAAIDAIRAAIAAKCEATVELLNYRRDGSEFWNRLLLSPIVDDRGAVIYYFASQLDVTAERLARDLAVREHALLREVDHRAKNALALVQGIVRLSRADDPAEYSRSIQGRVDALARAHILLSDAGWHEVALDTVIAAATAPFGQGRTPRDGPKLLLAAGQVQPLILAFHEVLNNALNHGGLSAEEGAATLRWRTEEGVVVIEVIESGGPPPAAPAKPGYGLTMVDAFVGRQLGGKVERSWHRRGLTTRMTFPRARAAAAR